MTVYTDNPASAAALLPGHTEGGFVLYGATAADHTALIMTLLGNVTGVHTSLQPTPGWNLMLVREFAPDSQYDRLIELARTGCDIPDRTVCIARSGSGFHGFRQRHWSAGTGNIHLTVHFAPCCTIERFDTIFAALAAVSVVEAIDEVAGLEGAASIKWVNDVLVHGRKVAGVLAYTQTRGPTVTTAILGIGVNVEHTPAIERSRFVPAVASLRDFAQPGSPVHAAATLQHVLAALSRNYDILLRNGYRSIMERYRARSAVIGQDVTICADDRPGEVSRSAHVLASGRVESIGDSLELHLAGVAEPVTSGRLILGDLQSVI